ncbi:MAG: protein kinase [Candidatus Obscuribacterales bacterium]|nr:protein kinase [Candidatus Obscuribacterales bacterium]
MQEQDQLDAVHLKIAEESQPFALTSAIDVVAEGEKLPALGEQYEVLELIGSGGMSLVYKVRERSTNRLLVAKVLRGGLLSDEVAKERFQQESTLVQQLTHANIIEVKGAAVTENGLPFLLMEWLDGITLADYIKINGALDAKEAVPLFQQMIDALSYAHRKGIIHRDVKPGNILLVGAAKELTVKIMDFGIAKILESEGVDADRTQEGSVLGSPAYMSPEQCLGENIDARSDLYSLGCVMYETLTGQNAFIASTSVATILRHLETDPESILSDGFVRSKVPEYLEQVIYRCLAKKPELRYQSALEIRSDLFPPPGVLRRLLSIVLDGAIFGSLAAVLYYYLLPVEWRDVLHLDYGVHIPAICLMYLIYRVVPEFLFCATPGMLITGLRHASSYGPFGRIISSAARALVVCGILVWLYVLPNGVPWSEAIDHATGSHVSALVEAGRWSWFLFMLYLIYLWIFVISKREQWFVNSLFGTRVVRKQAAKAHIVNKNTRGKFFAQSLLVSVALSVVCLLPQYRQHLMNVAWLTPSVTKDLAVHAATAIGKGQTIHQENLRLVPTLRTGGLSDNYFTSKEQVVGKHLSYAQSDGPIQALYLEGKGENVEGPAYMIARGRSAEIEAEDVLAEEYYRKALRVAPSDREALTCLVRVLEKQGWKNEANDVRKRILPLTAPDYAEFSALLNADDQCEVALIVGMQALKDRPNSLLALKQVVVAMKGLGAEAAPEPIYRRILALEPANLEALLFLSERTLERKEYAECKNFAQRIVAADASSARGWSILSEVLQNLGDEKGADDARTKILILDGKHAAPSYEDRPD